jgi:hypothetical protein
MRVRLHLSGSNTFPAEAPPNKSLSTRTSHWTASYPSRAASCRSFFAAAYKCRASFSAISCRSIAKRFENGSGVGPQLFNMPEVFSAAAK